MQTTTNATLAVMAEELETTLRETLAKVLSQGERDVLAERAYQLSQFPATFDDAQPEGRLSDAAAALVRSRDGHPRRRPHYRRRDLVHAAALIIAEIDRHDQTASPEALAP